MHFRTADLLQCQVVDFLQPSLFSKATERMETYPQLSTEEMYPRKEEDINEASKAPLRKREMHTHPFKLPLQAVQNGC